MKYKTVSYESLKEKIDVASGRKEADIVLKNARYINVFTETIECADIAIKNGVIVGIGKYNGKVEIDCTDKIVSPSLIDSHVHIESSMVSPRTFRDLVVTHGTCAVIADPHEITNVSGIDGINYMMEKTKDLDIFVGIMIPSCVPTTRTLDESGAIITSDDIKPLYQNDRVLGLAEMMNTYGIVNSSEYYLSKCIDAINEGLLIDGHAPSLDGMNLDAYISAGVSTDHECSTFEEAKEKIEKGLWIEIREGTACKDLISLIKLFEAPYCYRSMLSTDDCHPDVLVKYGHIDRLIRIAIENGADPIKAIKMASYNAALHYDLKGYGAIGVGYYANFVVLNNIEKFDIDSCYLFGNKVSERQKTLVNYSDNKNSIDEHRFDRIYYSFNLNELTEKSFAINESGTKLRAIEVISGGIITGEKIFDIDISNNSYIDLSRDIVKIAVIERHHNTGHVGIGFLTNYGIKRGAIATSVGHDSHNIIVVGTNDRDMVVASNMVKNNNGGIVVACDNCVLDELKLEIAGLMTDANVNSVIESLDRLKKIAFNKLMVNKDIDPFMTLSFMQLPVVPKLKIIPKGLVNVLEHKVVPSIF